MRTQYYRYGYDANQAQFDRQVGLMGFIFHWIFQLFVYSPLILIGFVIADKIMDHKTVVSVKGMALIAFFAVLQYGIIYLLRKAIVALRERRNYWWIPIYVVCVLYTCVLAAMIVYGPVRQLLHSMHVQGSSAVAVILVSLFGLYVHYKYHFFRRLQ